MHMNYCDWCIHVNEMNKIFSQFFWNLLLDEPLPVLLVRNTETNTSVEQVKYY